MKSAYPFQGLGDNNSSFSSTVEDYRCKGAHLRKDIGGSSSTITLDAKVEVLTSNPI